MARLSRPRHEYMSFVETEAPVNSGRGVTSERYGAPYVRHSGPAPAAA